MNISKMHSAMSLAAEDSTTAASARPMPATDMLLQMSELPSIEHSRILGSSYRRQRRYRPLPTVPRVLQTDVLVCCDLSSFSTLHTLQGGP